MRRARIGWFHIGTLSALGGAVLVGVLEVAFCRAQKEAADARRDADRARIAAAEAEYDAAVAARQLTYA